MKNEKEDAQKWREMQAAMLMDAYTADVGHPPTTTEELAQWAKDNPEKARIAAQHPGYFGN